MNGQGKSRNLNYKFVDEKNNNFENNLDMANYCNKYFNTVGIEMEKKIDIPQNPFSIDMDIGVSMFLDPVTVNELINHIATLKKNSAPGKDGISSRLIKYIHLEIVKPLSHIINLIFESDKVLVYFKESIITPILKANEKKLYS